MFLNIYSFILFTLYGGTSKYLKPQFIKGNNNKLNSFFLNQLQLKINTMPMSMDQLFKGLPRDLQWEILSEFVGSHSVRKGKLIKKLGVDYRREMVQYLVFRIMKCNIFVFKWNYDATTLVQMSDGSQLMFCECPINGEMGYVFRKRVVERKDQESWKKEVWITKPWIVEYTPMNVSVVLPPFEKHSYPSYPDTKKKKEARHPALKRIRPEP